MNRFAGISVFTAALMLFGSTAAYASPYNYKGNSPKVISNAKKQGTAAQKKENALRIDVGLLTGQHSVVIQAAKDIVVRDLSGGKVLNKFPGKSTVNFTYKSRQICINGKAVSAQKIIIQAGDSNITVSGDEYRGEIILLNSGSSIAVVNRVSLEDYVKGVVGTEMSPEWPAEALKAQAVAARTFSLYTKNEGKHDGDGWDICATTHCQVYGGTEDESDSVTKAVDATCGEIMTYDGKPIYAAFHTDSGGQTAACREVWGGELAYLASVSDPAGSPDRHWQVTLTAEQMAAKLKAAGKDVGTLKKITLSPLKLDKGGSGDRYASGRPAKIVFTGSSRSITVNGTQARSIFGLKSALFDFGSGRKGNDLTVKSGQKIVIDGYGFGHGLGLSQWGAKAMSAKHNYKEILNHYYTGVTITKLY
ncbi:MAG: SpoIID/LytB domain-containing protein [Selenomonadaceae bacterium]|nr:SpoIID/LytB domain-containing protein [Selenomonadaceae bacterium]